ncbi:ubiquinol-cytochrome c reductase complex 14 kDa protein [Dipodascopsis tothii]|uniref:ubiquinol-cytochrome c reductase complex 14 kDa protein n=1 Tax=Dipodascopsis tothii TaxID=44089 RepID=UPI0034CD1E24
MATSIQATQIAKYIKSKPALAKLLTPVAGALQSANGYRKMGLKFDDLIAEESPVVQKAISRLPKDDYYSRVFRLRRAMQLSLQQQILPKDQYLPAEEDTRYLLPYILEAQAEANEREELDNLVITRNK